MDLIEKGELVPDRENDQLTHALGNKEKMGRTRGTEESPAWMYGFDDCIDTYRSRARKRREEAEHVRQLQETVQRHERILESITSQGGTGPYRELDIVLLDATGPGSNWKSSVASTDLPEDGHEAMTEGARYPVDDITQQENCEMHVECRKLSLKVVAGYALPCRKNGTYHCVPIPAGYAIVTVDEVIKDWEQLELEIPAGEDRDITELGAAKGNTILWRKEHIKLLNWTPPPQPSPQRQPSPPPRDPSP